MIRVLAWVATMAAMVGIAACGEKPQADGGAKKPDTQAWQATGSGYVASGWKEGDRNSWEEQLRSRAQGQNDYAKTK